MEMGGGIFVVVALTPYGGWFKEAKEWMSRVAHTGDKVPHCGLAPRVHATNQVNFYTCKQPRPTLRRGYHASNLCTDFGAAPTPRSDNPKCTQR